MSTHAAGATCAYRKTSSYGRPPVITTVGFLPSTPTAAGV